MHTLLFLCTGNYYRSRFAEIYFNRLADERSLSWRATSRGLCLSSDNVGPLSPFARDMLEQLGFLIPRDIRDPQPLQAADLEAADRVIALKEAEHRTLFEQQFPGWPGRIEYWHIHDLDCSPPEAALGRLEQELIRLADELAQAGTGGDSGRNLSQSARS